MSKASAIELCQKLKSEAVAKQDVIRINNLRVRILDYFINRKVPDDVFEVAPEARFHDPDPDKEQSKVICTKILEAW